MASENKIDELGQTITSRIKKEGLSYDEASPIISAILSMLDELDDSLIDKYLRDINGSPKAKHDVLLEIAVYYHKGLFK